MESVLEYITLNYTWFLVGLIIILLAIIGYYADKTNFGQGKTEEEDEKNQNLENIKIQNNEEKQETEKKELEQTVESEPTKEVQPKVNVVAKEDKVTEKKDVVVEYKKAAETKNKKVDLDETFKKLDKEFDELLPKKEIIDDELLDEIDSLSLDKTQKLNLTDIPDLDDLDLPKIKSLKSIDEDIWKF